MVDKAMSVTIPPPVQGWNTRDPISEMLPTYAVDCENFYSDGYSVDLRKGTDPYATGFPFTTFISRVFSYQPQTGTPRLITVSQQKIFRTNSGGTQTDITGGAANVLNEVSSANFRGRIFFASSHPSLATMDIYSWNNTGNIALAGFTGPGGDDKALFNVTVYKSRLYFCGTDSLSIWYGGVDAITGALTQFDMQSVFSKGGKILYCGSASRTGQIDQDYFCAISSEGEVLIYQGDSPSSSTWALVGRYFMAPPASSTSFFYWGKNLVIITVQGILLLSDVMSGESDYIFLSDPINSEIVETIQQSVTNGNEIMGMYHPRGNKIILSLGRVGTDPFTDIPKIFVMSTLNRSWWKWSSKNYGVSSWFCAHLNDLYFATGVPTPTTTTTVGIYIETGYADMNGTGSNVFDRNIKLRPAFNYFGDRSHVKTFTSARPVIYQSEGLDLTMGADVDFGNEVATSKEIDLSDTSYKAYQPIMGLTGVGKCASIRIDGTVTTKRMSLQAIEVFYNQGGLI